MVLSATMVRYLKWFRCRYPTSHPNPPVPSFQYALQQQARIPTIHIIITKEATELRYV